MRNEEHIAQIANQHGTKKFNCQGKENLIKKSPQGTKNVNLKSRINQERNIKWSRNGGAEELIQGLKDALLFNKNYESGREHLL